MTKDIDIINSKLKSALKNHLGTLQISVDSEKNFEVKGTIEAMQGKKKVDGMYFSSVMPKAKDVRLYFFPIYTHPAAFSLSDDLKKFLKGKSCFHVKHLNDDLEREIQSMIDTGIKTYQKDGLLKK